MIKVFLVEDETHIRESIRETIDWETAGFEYAGDAPDGEVAVGDIRRLKPDIVITDIRMPFVDGLELTRIIRSEMPDIRILILSGFNEFTYAQTAISLGVSEYLLKPVSPSELMRALNKVALDLRRDTFSGLGINQLRKSFLRELLKGLLSPSVILSGTDEFKITLDSQYYLAAAIKSEKGADLRADIESVFDTSCFLAVETEHDEYGIIAQSNDAGRIEEKTMNLLSSLMKRAARQTGATLHAGVGMTVEHLHELGHSFREAETACNYAIFTGLSNPCLINSVKTDTVGFGLAEHLARAREFFLCGNQEEIEDFTKRLKNSALKGVATHYAYIDVLMTAARTLREMSASPEELLPELSMIGESAFSIDNPEELEAAVAKICERVILFRKKYLSNRRYKLVADAKQFIDGNFSDPELSLQKAASAAHVSPTYFSAVFSRETGETLSDYITRVRVKNAMKILKTTTLSASEVSAMVGFNDPLYFSRVFKRAVGVNVSEFRKK